MIRRAWYIACDRCGGYPTEISTESAVVARGFAFGEGYKRIGGEDVCPHCQGRTGYYSKHGGWVDLGPTPPEPTNE